jgi:ketosteroid isomerase-like protein
MDKGEAREALDSFRRYAEAFQSLDAKAVARHFHEPSLLITPQGIAAMRTIADVEQAYERVMTDLPAQGYAGTRFTSLDARQLGDELAVVTGAGVWKKATGEEFAPFGISYTLRRANGAWRIVVATIYRSSSKP